ncbi:hypothetical protein PLICRDRAFT_170639 [Plicaturopsis crispa FD-325 SS-3]|nr:hypothetical protein PLICRDRAFT_170639 [Plicaturopsis crispa FD-325 SS-3]
MAKAKKKPTLLQTILNRPSQSYSFPAEPRSEFHSSKRDLFRVAGPEADGNGSPVEAQAFIYGVDNGLAAFLGRAGGGDGGRMVVMDPSSSSSIEVRRSVPGFGPIPTHEQAYRLSVHQIHTRGQMPVRPRADVTNGPRDIRRDREDDEGSTNTKDGESIASNTSTDDEDEVFYTPNTSPHSSMHIDRSVRSIPNLFPVSEFASMKPTRATKPPQRSTSVDLPSASASLTSLASSTNTHESLFSSPLSSSTHATTVISASSTDSHKGKEPSETRGAYTDAHWAKDVRWLVAPPPGNTVKPKRSKSLSASAPRSSEMLSSGASSSSSSPIPAARPRRTNPPAQAQVHRRSKSTHSHGQVNMMTLLEVDEERERDSQVYGQPHSYQGHSVRARTASSHRSASQASDSTTTLPPISNPHTLRSPSSHHRSTRSATSSTISGHKTRTLPTPFPQSSTSAPSLPSGGTPGYTSLTLPRAALPTNGARDSMFGLDALSRGNGKVDLTRGGLAQTTMATVEIVKGVARVPTKRGGWFGRSASLNSFPSSFGSRSSLDALPADLKGKSRATGDTLGFTSHRPPPNHVPSGSVLVQVWAVGLDGVDGRLVSEKGGERFAKGDGKVKTEVGYIPGRSFVGRVLESGWEVREEVCRRGEWIVGLCDVRKCGALAEFILVDRHRIHRVPYPRMPASPSQPMSSSPTSGDALTLEELALLPLTGVPAYRAMRTFSSAGREGISNRADRRDGSGAWAHKRILVLDGHVGVGALAVQMLARRGWRVCAHVPFLAPDDPKDDIEIDGAAEVVYADGMDAAGVLGLLARRKEVFDAILDTIGGREVWEAGERLLGGRGQFTTLVGDVPGRPIPSAKDHFRAGMRSMGATGSTEGGAKKEKKVKGGVGYAWVSVAADVDWEGEDVRDSLGAVLRLAAEEGLRPVLGLGAEDGEAPVIPFERTPEVFGRMGEGGTAVVRIVI